MRRVDKLQVRAGARSFPERLRAGRENAPDRGCIGRGGFIFLEVSYEVLPLVFQPFRRRFAERDS